MTPTPSMGRWALDSGAFSELNLYGCYRTSAKQYADEAIRYHEEIGNMDFAAIQDWMCEPFMLKKTGLTVREHQQRTIDSYLELKSLAPGVPWAPVLQGWWIDDYLRHAEQYEASGVDLRSFSRVGVGSVCKRQATQFAFRLFRELSALGLKLHGFGLKAGFFACGLSLILASCDSMAWSFEARARKIKLDGCKHPNCKNCLKYALLWREQLLREIKRVEREIALSDPCL